MQLRSLLVGGSILVTGLSVSMSACSVGSVGGGGTSGGSGASNCASTGKRICERACVCGAPKCKTGIPNSFGSFTTLTWSDSADCEGGYAGSRCKNGDSPQVDYGTCMASVEAASCDGDVFVVPASCEAPRDAGR